MKIRRLIFIFVAAFFVFVAVNVPIALFIKDGRLGPAQVYSAEGTIWSGRANLVRFQGHDIKTPTWSVKPWYLLIGRVQAAVGFSYLEGTGKGDVSASLSKKVKLSDFEFSLPADQLTQQFANGFVGLEGNMTLQIDELDYAIGEAFVQNVSGYLGWQKSGVAYPISGTFGNISALISQNDDGLLTADLSNKGGELSISGTAALNPILDFDVDVTMKPKSNMSGALRDTLNSVARPKPDGSYPFKRSGNLRRL